MDGLISTDLQRFDDPALQPSMAFETSAFNKIRAFRSRWAGLGFRLRVDNIRG
jgi:hypothetical protein